MSPRDSMPAQPPPPPTEEILRRIAELGYRIDAGTAGYRIRMAATRDHIEHIVTEDDEHTAALKLAEVVGLTFDS